VDKLSSWGIRKRRDEDDFWAYFQDIDKMFENIFKSLEQGDKEFVGGPIFYGFSWNVGPDGKPIVREFGNVRSGYKGVKRSDVRTPFYDIVMDEKNNELNVIVELPGVDKEKVSVNATPESVEVEAEGSGRRYAIDIPLDLQIDPETAKATFNNGILQVTFKLKRYRDKGGVRINIG
jgi:HSP20 family protein